MYTIKKIVVYLKFVITFNIELDSCHESLIFVQGLTSNLGVKYFIGRSFTLDNLNLEFCIAKFTKWIYSFS